MAKADKQALKSLFFVPRYQGATIHQLRKVKFGEQQDAARCLMSELAAVGPAIFSMLMLAHAPALVVLHCVRDPDRQCC